MIETRGRILFVDNDKETRDMMRALLTQAGYETVEAATVTEGLKMAKGDNFDLVLTAWYFSDGTGVDLCQKIRSFDSDIPIFFYTGMAYESEMGKAMDAGAYGYFIKPVEVKKLLQTLSTQTKR